MSPAAAALAAARVSATVVGRPAVSVVKRERGAVLSNDSSRNRPSFGQVTKRTVRLSERQFVVIAENKPQRVGERRRALLLLQVRRVVRVGLSVADAADGTLLEVGKVLAPSKCALHGQTMRILFPHGGLETVVMIASVVLGALYADRLVTKIGHTIDGVSSRVGRNAIDRIAGTRQLRQVIVVVVIGLVDAARSYITDFQHPRRQELVLKTEVVLPGERSVDGFVERSVQTGVCARRRIEIARREPERGRRKRVGQAIGHRAWTAVIQSERVRIALLHSVDELAAADAVIETDRRLRESQACLYPTAATQIQHAGQSRSTEPSSGSGTGCLW